MALSVPMEWTRRTVLALVAAMAAPAGAQGSQGDGSVPERRFDGAFEPNQGFGTRPADGLLAFCTPITSTVPARLAPGTGGRLLAVLSLKGRAVFAAGTRMRVEYANEQHGIHLGRWTISAATPGKRAPAYKGLPVHEDTATLEIPLTVDPNAAAGAHTVTLTLDADVHDGNTGQLICAAQMPIRAVVTLGAAPASASIPAPGSRALDATATAGSGTASRPTRTPAPATQPQTSVEPGVPAATEGAGPTAAADSLAAAPSDSGGDWLLVGAVAALVLGLAGLLFARRGR